MSELKNKFGKFLIILGGISLLLFAFSIIADSAEFYLLITGILIILFGTILRRKPKSPEVGSEDSITKPEQGRNQRRDKINQTNQENRQSRRSRRSKY